MKHANASKPGVPDKTNSIPRETLFSLPPTPATGRRSASTRRTSAAVC